MYYPLVKNIGLFVLQVIIQIFSLILVVFAFIRFPGGLFRLIFVSAMVLCGVGFIVRERNIKIFFSAVSALCMTIGRVVILRGIRALAMAA